ncbi:outer membrane protein [Microvirga sp. M2]|uniref:outer membrane protein n=1 Tax=Microvirga sp. M2 TaxID=3073270 RepID=UPI0039C2E9D6
MKSFFLSASVLLGATVAAAAADLPSRAAPVLPLPAAPAVSWSGWYLGAHGAWISDQGAAERTGVLGVAPAALPARAGLRASGLGGGAQVGYLWQFGDVVAGLEADLSALDVGQGRSSVGVAGPFALRTDLSSQLRWFGTLKGRVGLVLPSLVPLVEQSLVYVTGGLASAQIEHQGAITVTPPGVGPALSRTAWTSGFVLGAGAEHRLTPNLSLTSETLYYKLADETLTLARAGDQASYRFKNDGWISRLGLNVRF